MSYYNQPQNDGYATVSETYKVNRRHPDKPLTQWLDDEIAFWEQEKSIACTKEDFTHSAIITGRLLTLRNLKAELMLNRIHIKTRAVSKNKWVKL